MTTLKEAQNTLGADINEILLGYYLGGGSWAAYGSQAKEVQAQVDARKAAISPEEYKDQAGRAKAMATMSLAWAAANGYSGKVARVWWTARPGVLSAAFGKPVDSSKNPTDILAQFSDGKFLGFSAKSTKGKGDIGFKNPGAGTIGSALGVDFGQYFKNITAKAIKDMNLPLDQKARKEYIRKNPKIQAKTVAIGVGILTSLRDALLKSLQALPQKALKDHLLNNWLDAGAVEPRYIKVTGHGSGGNSFSASLTDPLKNPKLQALTASKITVVAVGSDSVGAMAGDKRLLKMRFKYESEKLASSVKLSGDPWG